MDNTIIQNALPTEEVLARGAALAVECVVQDGSIRAWRISDGVTLWHVDDKRGRGALRVWLEKPTAPKVTFFDEATWRAVGADGLRLAGAVDVALAIGVVTAGLQHARLDPASVIAAFCPDLGVPRSDVDQVSGLVRVWDRLAELLDDAGLRETAVLETAVAPVLAVLAARGLPVDVERWDTCVTRARAAVAAAVDKFAAVTGAPVRLGGGAVNLCSDAEVLDGFRRVGAAVPPDLRQGTLRAAALDPAQPPEFAAAVEALLAFRGAKQVVDWSDAPHPDGRLRGSWRQLGTATGRSTSAEVNLHGVPVPLRAAVRAPSGSRLVVADYAGQDLRVLAALAGDRRLAEDLNRGDIYDLVARRLGVDRKVAKPAVLAYFYGASDSRLAALLGRSVDESKALRQLFATRFPDAAQLLEGATIRAGSLPEPIATLTGEAGELVLFRGVDRWRWARSAASPAERARLSRQAGNFPVQSRAATLSKVALGRAARMLAVEVPEAAVVHFVVDELIVETPAEQADRTAQIVGEAMSWAHLRKLGNLVHPAVDVHVVESWANAKQATRATAAAR